MFDILLQVPLFILCHYCCLFAYYCLFYLISSVFVHLHLFLYEGNITEGSTVYLSYLILIVVDCSALKPTIIKAVKLFTVNALSVCLFNYFSVGLLSTVSL